MKVMKAKAILVNEDGYLYLQNRSYFERCGKEYTEKQIERFKRNFEDFNFFDGYYRMCDGSLGGCIGPWENAFEEGRWTSWFAEEMARMLDAQGIEWKPTEDAEFIRA